MTKTTKRIIQLGLALIAAPYLGVFLFITARWVLTGYMPQGGGDRAMVSFFMSLLPAMAAAILEIE